MRVTEECTGEQWVFYIKVAQSIHPPVMRISSQQQQR